MKMIELKCKNCGAALEVEEEAKSVTCEYCHTTFLLDDEVQHIQHDNMYESGYEFEKGRIQAQNENAKDVMEEMFKPSPLAKIISKILVFICIIIVVVGGIFIFKELKYGYELNKKMRERTSNFGSSFNAAKQEYEEMVEKQNELKSESDKNSFNFEFEAHSGTQGKIWINYLLDDVVTNNKTNSDHLVSVIFGETETSDPDSIIDIKHSIKEKNEYEIVLDYDEDGYVNLITIRDI